MDFLEEKDFMVAVNAQKMLRQTPFEGKFAICIVQSGYYEPHISYRKLSLDEEKIQELNKKSKGEEDPNDVMIIEVERDFVLGMVRQFELLGFDFMPSYCIVPVVRKVVADEVIEKEIEDAETKKKIWAEDGIVHTETTKPVHISYDK